uniref:uncharacterized protein n=1 Tax=Myxine glutinosa TaxID=7769 RepID=UPI00358F86FA
MGLTFLTNQGISSYSGSQSTSAQHSRYACDNCTGAGPNFANMSNTVSATCDEIGGEDDLALGRVCFLTASCDAGDGGGEEDISECEKTSYQNDCSSINTEPTKQFATLDTVGFDDMENDDCGIGATESVDDKYQRFEVTEGRLTTLNTVLVPVDDDGMALQNGGAFEIHNEVQSFPGNLVPANGLLENTVSVDSVGDNVADAYAKSQNGFSTGTLAHSSFLPALPLWPMPSRQGRGRKKAFHCKSCQLQVESEAELVQHFRTHGDRKLQIEEQAERMNLDSGNMPSHTADGKAIGGNGISSMPRGPIRCEECGYNTSRYDHYLAHLKHHEQASGAKGTLHVLSCTLCPYSTVSRYHWKKHLRNHFPCKVYTCSECSYFSDRKNNYLQHMRTHTGERPYCCPHCSYRSSQKTHLTRHMRVHSGEKPFKCMQCSYVAANQHEVTRHFRQVHNGPKPFGCEHCNYRTADRSNYKKHVELHTRPRQFHCPVCHYAASKKCNLQYHIRSKHPDSNLVTMDVSHVRLRGSSRGRRGVGMSKTGFESKRAVASNTEDDVESDFKDTEKGNCHANHVTFVEKYNNDANDGVVVVKGRADAGEGGAIDKDKSDADGGTALGNDKSDAKVGTILDNDKNDVEMGTPVGKGKRYVEKGKPVGKGKSDVEKRTPVGKGKCDAGKGTPVGKDRSDVGKVTAVGKGKSDVEKGAPVGKGKRDVQKSTPVGKGKSDVEMGTPVGKGKSDVEMGTPLDKGESVKENGTPLGKGKRDVKKSTPVGKGKSDVSKGTPVGKGKHDVEKGTPVGKGKRDVKKGAPVGKGKSDVDKCKPVGKGKSDVEKDPPVGKGKSDVEKDPPVGKGKRDVEMGTPVGKGKSDVEKDPPVGKGKSDVEMGTPVGKGKSDGERIPRKGKSNMKRRVTITRRKCLVKTDSVIETSEGDDIIADGNNTVSRYNKNNMEGDVAVTDVTDVDGSVSITGSDQADVEAGVCVAKKKERDKGSSVVMVKGKEEKSEGGANELRSEEDMEGSKVDKNTELEETSDAAEPGRTKRRSKQISILNEGKGRKAQTNVKTTSLSLKEITAGEQDAAARSKIKSMDNMHRKDVSLEQEVHLKGRDEREKVNDESKDGDLKSLQKPDASNSGLKEHGGQLESLQGSSPKKENASISPLKQDMCKRHMRQKHDLAQQKETSGDCVVSKREVLLEQTEEHADQKVALCLRNKQSSGSPRKRSRQTIPTEMQRHILPKRLKFSSPVSPIDLPPIEKPFGERCERAGLHNNLTEQQVSSRGQHEGSNTGSDYLHLGNPPGTTENTSTIGGGSKMKLVTETVTRDGLFHEEMELPDSSTDDSKPLDVECFASMSPGFACALGLRMVCRPRNETEMDDKVEGDSLAVAQTKTIDGPRVHGGEAVTPPIPQSEKVLSLRMTDGATRPVFSERTSEDEGIDSDAESDSLANQCRKGLFSDSNHLIRVTDEIAHVGFHAGMVKQALCDGGVASSGQVSCTCEMKRGTCMGKESRHVDLESLGLSGRIANLGMASERRPKGDKAGYPSCVFCNMPFPSDKELGHHLRRHLFNVVIT